jgi:hypothetical protein
LLRSSSRRIEWEIIMNRPTFTTRWLFAGTAALALGAVTAPVDAGQRPLSDFTSRQGEWCAVPTASQDAIDCAASYYLSAANPDCLQGFTSTFPQAWTDPHNEITAFIDALGELDDGSFGTTVDGSIAESPARGGLADVKILVHTNNALMRAFDANFDIVFGHGFGEVLNGAEPTLGDLTLQVTFTNTAPGALLPDFSQLTSCPLPGQALQVLSIRARASGPLREAFGVPEGTPGRMEVTQTGLIGTSQIVNPHSRVAVDAYPAEKIIIRPTGK